MDLTRKRTSSGDGQVLASYRVRVGFLFVRCRQHPELSETWQRWSVGNSTFNCVAQQKHQKEHGCVNYARGPSFVMPQNLLHVTPFDSFQKVFFGGKIPVRLAHGINEMYSAGSSRLKPRRGGDELKSVRGKA